MSIPKYLVIVVFLMSFLVDLSAQGDQRSYDQLIDLINCKIVGISLADQNDGEGPYYGAFDALFKCKGGEADNKAIQAFLIDRDLDLTLAINQQVDSFKLRFDSTTTNSEVRALIQDDLLDKKLSNFAANHPESFATLRSDLAIVMDAVLDREKVTVPPETKSSRKGEKENPTDKKSKVWLIWLLALVLLTLLGMLYSRFSKKRLLPEKENPNPQIEFETMEKYDQHIRRLSEDNLQLRKEVDLLKEQIRLIHEKINSLPKVNQIQVDPPHVDQRPIVTETKADPVQKVFYMRTPHRDGYFNNQSKSSHFRPFESVYTFELDDADPNVAHFHLVNDNDTMTQAIQTYNRYIEPVCESEEPFNPKANRIVTIKPGTAILKGDRWEVTEKASIRYE